MNINVLNDYYKEIGSNKRVKSSENCFIVYEVFSDYLYVWDAYTKPESRGSKMVLEEFYSLLKESDRTKGVWFVGTDNANLNVNTHLYLSRGAKILSTNDKGIHFVFESKE